MARKRKTNYMGDERFSPDQIFEVEETSRAEKMDWGFVLMNQVALINKSRTFMARGGMFEQQYIDGVKQLHDLLTADFDDKFKADMTKLNKEYVNWFAKSQKKTISFDEPGQFYTDLYTNT